MALDWVFEWHRSRDLVERARVLSAGLEDRSLQARVLLGVGRSLQRFNQDREAAEVLRQAARQAEALGDQGYEVFVTADLLLGFLLPFLGLLDEAEERLEQVGRRCEAKSDELHLCAMWGNRSCVWIARNDRERFLQDNARVLDYARRMGSVNVERVANVNCAYFLYWRGEFAAAEPFARRIIEIDERYFGQGGSRPDGTLLLARILWGQGQEATAATLVQEIHAHQTAARDQGKTNLLLQPNDELLLDMITLVVAGAALEAWEPLIERARKIAQGQELIELLEIAGLAAQRRKNTREARRWWQEALSAGERLPNVMSPRIRDRLLSLAIPSSPSSVLVLPSSPSRPRPRPVSTPPPPSLSPAPPPPAGSHEPHSPFPARSSRTTKVHPPPRPPRRSRAPGGCAA